jgi:hypothetical protein
MEEKVDRYLNKQVKSLAPLVFNHKFVDMLPHQLLRSTEYFSRFSLVDFVLQERLL